MLSALRWFIGLIITLIIASFAAFNRAEIAVTLTPFSDAIMMPAYALIIVSFGFGFLFGGSIVWLNASKSRKERRKQRKEIKRLERELNQAKENKVISKNAPALEIFPALPSK